MKLDKHSVCKMPWNSVFVHPDGTIRPCCIQNLKYGDTLNGDTIESTWNSSAAVDFRGQFLKGKIPTNCQICYDKEYKIGSSLRTAFEKSDLDNKSELELTEFAPFDLTHIDISLSNLCNLKCRFCGPHNSTAWMSDEKELEKKDHRFWSRYMTFENKPVRQDVNQYIDLIKKMPNLKQIELKGGEPLLNQDFYTLLRFLVSSEVSGKIELSITSNGTIINEELKELLPHFKTVLFSISVDGTKKLYQYIRGGQYSLETDIEKNVQFFEKIKKVRLFFGATISAYNLFDIGNISNWFSSINHNFNKKIRYGLVTDPKPLDPTKLPFKIRKHAMNKLNGISHSELSHLFKSLNQPEDRISEERYFQDFVQYVRDLDAVRGSDFLSVGPEYREYF